MTRRLLFPMTWLILTALPVGLRAATPPLLHQAVVNWSAGKEEWAFIQRSRALADDGSVKEERLERYDPSRPDDRRWQLLSVNGQFPTEAQRESIEDRRNHKPRRYAGKTPAELLDFPDAMKAYETPSTVTYEVALRPEAARLVQTEKLILLITVGRENHAIERITAGLREPMRAALGLAKVTDVDFDLSFDADDKPARAGAGDDEPSGTARVTLSKFGERMEYEWSNFRRVNSYRGDDPRSR